MQMQPVIMMPPGSGHGILFLDDRKLHIRPPQAGGRGQPGYTGPNDQYLRLQYNNSPASKYRKILPSQQKSSVNHANLKVEERTPHRSKALRKTGGIRR